MRVIKSILIFAIFLLTSYTAVNAENVYDKTFEESLGEWTQTVGTTEFKRTNNQMSISNTTQGSNIESIAILNDSPIFKDGEVEMNFLYEGQKNFSLIFRADLSDKSKWQTVAYNTEGKWTVGQPGGKWLSNIDGPTLVNGKTYRLLICYEGKKIEVFLDDELFYKNDEVVYPNSTTIDSEWEGKLGVRLFGDRSTLKINSLKSGPIGSIRVNEENLKQFELMKDRWKSNLVGDFDSQSELQNDEQVKGYISQLSNNSKELLTSMNQSIGRVDLWEQISSDTASANLTTQFKKINTLAKAYGTKGTDLYQNKELLDAIVSGLDFLTADGRYSGTKYFGNWWDWQIGVPQEFVSTLMILYDDIDDANIERYVSIMSKYLPNPYQQMYGKPQTPAINLSFIPDFKNSGANRTDHALSVLGIGLLSNNSFKITEAVGSIEEIFETVTSGDGFYADGSFIQHTYIPYTGSYGNVLIKGVGKIYSVVSDTKWESNESSRTDFVSKVTDSFIPIIVNGETMSFVNGRSITRAPTSTQNGFGSTTLYNLLITAEFADETNKNLLSQTAKYWMTQNIDYYLDNTRDFKDLLLTKSVLSDTTVDTPTKPFLGSHVYGAMDRYVYSNSDISLGISMHSKRISAYEAINKENKKGWHTSDGMIYLYNNDGQFGSSYWPTVDWYRLPGTTVDTRPLVDELSFKEFRSIEDYVGGAYNNEDAVVSMQLNKAGTYNGASLIDMNLKAKKSWFVFDGKIISLGSDINGTSDTSIETIIDNRMLDSSSQYQMVNQKGEDLSNSDSQNKKPTDWFLLKSSANNQSIGYLMLGNQSVTTKKEIRKGTYQQINNAFPSDLEYEETYQKIMVNHGNDVNDGTYAYVTYPNADENKLDEIKTSNRYSVMENSEDIQAVKDNVEHKVGITFWNEAGGSIGGVSSNKSSSVLYSEIENEFEISISNPKQTSEVIEVELPHEVKNIVSKDESMQLVNDTTIQVDTSGALGKTFHLKANYEKQENEIDVESIKISNNALEILKKGRTLNLNAEILPENATNQSVKWESMNTEIAEIQGNKLIGKKPGITKVKALSKNGKEDTFTIRVTR